MPAAVTGGLSGMGAMLLIPGSGARVVHPKKVTAKGTGRPVSVRRLWYHGGSVRAALWRMGSVLL